jgi:hypothetical protein
MFALTESVEEIAIQLLEYFPQLIILDILHEAIRCYHHEEIRTI